MSLTSATVVAAVALLAPLLANVARLPAIVLQLLFGIAIGPQVLSFARADEPVSVLALIGLGFLLLLAGLEIDFARLRGPVLRTTSVAFAVSTVLALGVGEGLASLNVVKSATLIAVVLSATSLGIVVPVLEDSGRAATEFGQIVIAAGSLAEVLPIVLLSLLFSRHSTGLGAQVVLFVAFTLFITAIGLTIARFEKWRRVSEALSRLQDTTAEIRVRGAFLLLMLCASLATAFGLEAILGAFLAGATLKLIDRDATTTHPLLHTKLHAIGYGVFVPYFFTVTGMNLDVRALLHESTLERVPIFLLAILLVRGLPAVLYRQLVPDSRAVLAAGFLQATSLSIPIVAGQLGVDLGLLKPDNYVALVAAGLVSVIAFPLIASTLLSGSTTQTEAAAVASTSLTPTT